MLDTNIVSGIIHEPNGRLRTRLEAAEGTACISVMTSSELKYGAFKRGSARLTRDIDRILSVIAVLPFEQPADVEYGRIRAALAAAGTFIGPVDLFIAAHALALGLTLVTANMGEFSRVPGLKVENWLD